MISVHNLTKYYGDYAAVRGVSFEVPGGQIVGFLGPNGAGKSTTMRILAGYLAPTSGSATIGGIDVFWDSVNARKRIGYMPESCPLYTEMRVSEYLHFRAGLKGLSGSQRRQRIAFVLERCWINDVKHQIIGTLSKGYRQRVGLADALLADPKVLILDEPTAGLDPTQIRETRALIRELGKQHTILLSTHILSEVEMTCDRVIIIYQGQVAAQGSLEELSKSTGDQAPLTAVFDGMIDPNPISALPGVQAVEAHPAAGQLKLHIFSQNPGLLGPVICQLAARNQWKLRELRPAKQSLEEMFVRLTSAS